MAFGRSSGMMRPEMRFRFMRYPTSTVWQGGNSEGIPCTDFFAEPEGAGTGSQYIPGQAADPTLLAGMRLPPDEDEGACFSCVLTLILVLVTERLQGVCEDPSDSWEPPEFPQLMEDEHGNQVVVTENCIIPLPDGITWQAEKNPKVKPRYLTYLEKK